ncbi:MAG: dihydroorotase [Actinomycetota bacterium]|nr:dihydroorotase [Actinomycetota bacterium]
MDLTIRIPRPDDWHVHLRDGAMLEAVVGYTANRFRYAMIMPNLSPPVSSTKLAEHYRKRIIEAAGDQSPEFQPLMTLYCSANLDKDDLLQGYEAGVVTAVKYYPAGATTNSSHGGENILDFIELFETMAEHKIPLLVHAESTNTDIDLFDREAAFLEQELHPLCEQIPDLQVTVEHVSTRAGVDFVLEHPRVGASVTPHHLSRNKSDLLTPEFDPDLFCKPIINSESDRQAIVAVVTSGDPSFFLGTDSAPHPTSEKYGEQAKAGIFNAAYGLEVVAEIFAEENTVENFSAFASQNGAAFYGYEPSEDELLLTRKQVEVELASTLSTSDGDQVVLFGVNEASHWTISTI